LIKIYVILRSQTTGILTGEMAERSNAAVLKTVVPATVPGVRIPLSPQIHEHARQRRACLFLQYLHRKLFLQGANTAKTNNCGAATVFMGMLDACNGIM
jgi:hypothetical protein